ncbi:MAG: hypothetical protein AAB909_01410 [Patescibacteria group bacterium]
MDSQAFEETGKILGKTRVWEEVKEVKISRDPSAKKYAEKPAELIKYGYDIDNHPDYQIAKRSSETGITIEGSHLLFPVELHKKGGENLFVYPLMEASVEDLTHSKPETGKGGVSFFELEDTKRIINDVAIALDALKIKLGVSHGDIRMRNIRVRDGEYYLADFSESNFKNPDFLTDKVQFCHLIKCLLVGKLIDQTYGDRPEAREEAINPLTSQYDEWLNTQVGEHYPNTILEEFQKFERSSAEVTNQVFAKKIGEILSG